MIQGEYHSLGKKSTKIRQGMYPRRSRQIERTEKEDSRLKTDCQAPKEKGFRASLKRSEGERQYRHTPSEKGPLPSEVPVVSGSAGCRGPEEGKGGGGKIVAASKSARKYLRLLSLIRRLKVW